MHHSDFTIDDQFEPSEPVQELADYTQTQYPDSSNQLVDLDNFLTKLLLNEQECESYTDGTEDQADEENGIGLNEERETGKLEEKDRDCDGNNLDANKVKDKSNCVTYHFTVAVQLLLAQACCLVFAFILHHNLSNDSVGDFLRLIANAWLLITV